jgi:uncharacterized protein DUF4349
METLLRSIVLSYRRLSPLRRSFVFAGAFFSVFLLLFLLSSIREYRPAHQASVGTASIPDHESASAPSTDSNATAYSPVRADKTLSPPLPYKMSPVGSIALPNEPHIAYSAELALATKEFSRSRISLEEILDRHHGYIAKLHMIGQPSGSVLNATLRIPSSEYRSALVDLKSVGNVEHEEESADEITQQHYDLEARLLNAQNEERKLQQLLNDKSPQRNTLAPVESQLALLRRDIESLQFERSSASNPVAFASISFSLHEDRTAPAESIFVQLRSAAGSGFGDALGFLSAFLLFAVSRGPLLLLWAIVLYLPARFFWRRRSFWGFGQTDPQKAP